MANKEKIDYLLIDIRELEKLVAGMRDAEIYPASFFNQTFQLTHKVLKELHTLEEFQLEALRKQMEEHQRLIDSIPVSKPLQMPEVQPAPEVSPTIEVVQVQEPVVEEPIVVEPIVEKVIPEEKIVQETIPLKEIEIPHKTILADKSSISLNDILEKKNLSDFRKAFSLNDRFRFRRELFGGNEEKMNKAILLSEKQKTNLHWDERITCESNLELYRELTEKHLHSIYQRHPRSIGKCLADGEGAFKLLDIEEQVKILCDIVQYTSFQRGVFSLKVLGGPKEVGRIRISGNMTEAKECKLVNYSITGMYKTEMDLLKK